MLHTLQRSERSLQSSKLKQSQNQIFFLITKLCYLHTYVPRELEGCAIVWEVHSLKPGPQLLHASELWSLAGQVGRRRPVMRHPGQASFLVL